MEHSLFSTFCSDANSRSNQAAFAWAADISPSCPWGSSCRGTPPPSQRSCRDPVPRPKSQPPSWCPCREFLPRSGSREGSCCSCREFIPPPHSWPRGSPCQLCPIVIEHGPTASHVSYCENGQTGSSGNWVSSGGWPSGTLVPFGVNRGWDRAISLRVGVLDLAGGGIQVHHHPLEKPLTTKMELFSALSSAAWLPTPASVSNSPDAAWSSSLFPRPALRNLDHHADPVLPWAFHLRSAFPELHHDSWEIPLAWAVLPCLLESQTQTNDLHPDLESGVFLESPPAAPLVRTSVALLLPAHGWHPHLLLVPEEVSKVYDPAAQLLHEFSQTKKDSHLGALTSP